MTQFVRKNTANPEAAINQPLIYNQRLITSIGPDAGRRNLLSPELSIEGWGISSHGSLSVALALTYARKIDEMAGDEAASAAGARWVGWKRKEGRKGEEGHTTQT
ncbi:hypothetical protein AKJ16_DCAP04306 [Drosera capensis]